MMSVIFVRPSRSSDGGSDGLTAAGVDTTHPHVRPSAIRAAQFNDSDLETEADLPSLEAMIPKELLRKLKPKEKKRQEVINGT